jgi:transcriptional regulator with XRE-family HTH domain
MQDKKGEISSIEISEMDYLLIIRVKELRQEKGISQVTLTQKMGLSEGFVGKVELFSERAKYNIRHLPLLARALSCKIADLFPRNSPKHDLVKITFRRTYKLNKDGTTSKKKQTEVLNIEAI